LTTFTAESLKPGKPRVVTFARQSHRLTGELVVQGDETASQIVILKPWGVLTGRVVKADSQAHLDGRPAPLTPPVRARHSGCPIDHQATTRAVNGYGFPKHARSCNVGRVPLDSVVSPVAAAVRNDLGRYTPTRRT
jgi:hypothetical protein